MSLPSLMLRVLLVVALVLNGTGTALATAHVHATHADAARLASEARDAAVAAHEEAASCHDQGLPPRAADPATDPAPVPEAPIPGDPEDCCDTTACGCACAHTATAAVLAPPSGWPVAARAPDPPIAPTTHAEPSLPRLIRPPIG